MTKIFPENEEFIKNYIYQNLLKKTLNLKDFNSDISLKDEFSNFEKFYINELKNNTNLTSSIESYSILAFNFLSEIKNIINSKYKINIRNDKCNIEFNSSILTPEISINNKELNYFSTHGKLSLAIEASSNYDTLNLNAPLNHIYLIGCPLSLKNIFSSYLFESLDIVCRTYEKELIKSNKEMINVEIILEFFHKNKLEVENIFDKNSYYHIKDIISILKDHDSMLLLKSDKSIMKNIIAIEKQLNKENSKKNLC